MVQKRLRIFAGPNGSGKSSMLKKIPESVPLGYYINADDIEKRIRYDKGINLNEYGVTSNTKDFQKFLKESEFARIKSDISCLKETFSISDNILITVKGSLLPKYSAAIISDFLRKEILKAGQDFSFETVMSHPDKLEFIRKANEFGYHVYLYFISTDDVRVNIERVKTRVKDGGHNVPETKIRTRYIRSHELLFNALKMCYKSYLFDNSDNMVEIARIDRDGMLYFSVTKDKIPNWLITYVILKS